MPKFVAQKIKQKLTVKFSEELRQYLENGFSPYFERAFMLFEKNGIVSKAVESTNPNSPRSFRFDYEHLIETIRIMQKEGYTYVGSYHHHLDSDKQIALRKNPSAIKEYLRLPEKYNPDQPSPDDLYGYKIGFDPQSEKTPESQLIIAGTKYLFLGHKSNSIPFHIRAYMPIHWPANKSFEELTPTLKDSGLLLDHYSSKMPVIDNPINYIQTNDNDPSAKNILRKYNRRFRIKEFRFGNNENYTRLKMYIKDGQITMIERYTNNYVMRYFFNNNKLDRITVFIDNTSRLVYDTKEVELKDDIFKTEKAKLDKVLDSLRRFDLKQRSKPKPSPKEPLTKRFIERKRPI